MKHIAILALVLATFFGSTFFIMTKAGWLSVESIEALLQAAKNIDMLYLFGCVVVLLFADLFIAVPTMTICLLSGFFLGFPIGFVSALLGMSAAGVSGYLLSKKYGRKLLNRIYKNKHTLTEMEQAFHEKGALVILLCRALPMLPEISCCLAGVNKMSFRRFISLYMVATLPYALITSLAGAYSTIENPMPAVYAAVFLSVSLWGGWYFLFRRKSSLKNVTLTKECSK